MLVVEPVQEDQVADVVRLAGNALRLDPTRAEMNQPCCMVAREVATGRIMGFALADRQAACESHLLALAVDGHHRGEGIGSRLLERVRHQMRQEGAMRMVLDVRADDRAAQAFYVRHGFSPEGLHRQAYPDGEDAVQYARPL